MRRTIAIAVLLLESMTMMSSHAATITVTNTNDSGPGSLRQALAVAHDGDRITFAVSGTITLTSGGLAVFKNVTISGPGADQLSIDANSSPIHLSSGFYVAAWEVCLRAEPATSSGTPGEVPEQKRGARSGTDAEWLSRAPRRPPDHRLWNAAEDRLSRRETRVRKRARDSDPGGSRHSGPPVRRRQRALVRRWGR